VGKGGRGGEPSGRTRNRVRMDTRGSKEWACKQEQGMGLVGSLAAADAGSQRSKLVDAGGATGAKELLAHGRRPITRGAVVVDPCLRGKDKVKFVVFATEGSDSIANGAVGFFHEDLLGEDKACSTKGGYSIIKGGVDVLHHGVGFTVRKVVGAAGRTRSRGGNQSVLRGASSARGRCWGKRVGGGFGHGRRCRQRRGPNRSKGGETGRK
jgi:hypothetical protein